MFRLVTVFLLVALTAACQIPGPKQTPTVNGVVTFRGEAPPASSVLQVRIVENANWPDPFVVGIHKIVNPGPSPVEFAFDYNPREIDPNTQYMLEAEIVYDGRVLASSERPYFVITDGYRSQKLVVPLRRF